MTREQHRSRVRTATAWIAAGAVALTAGFSLKAARTHAGTHQAPAATRSSAPAPSAPAGSDPGLQPPAQPPTPSDGLPAAGSGGS